MQLTVFTLTLVALFMPGVLYGQNTPQGSTSKAAIAFATAVSRMENIEYDAELLQMPVEDKSFVLGEWQLAISGHVIAERLHGWRAGESERHLPGSKGEKTLFYFDGVNQYTKMLSKDEIGVILSKQTADQHYADIGIALGDNLGPFFSERDYYPLAQMVVDGVVIVQDTGDRAFTFESREKIEGRPYYVGSVELDANSMLPRKISLQFFVSGKGRQSRKVEVTEFGKTLDGLMYPAVFQETFGEDQARTRLLRIRNLRSASKDLTIANFRPNSAPSSWEDLRHVQALTPVISDPSPVPNRDEAAVNWTQIWILAASSVLIIIGLLLWRRGKLAV